MFLKFLKSSFLAAFVLASSLGAQDIHVSAGFHDFVVQDIKDDGGLHGIPSGDSHTFGVNVGIWAQHTTPSKINILAKAEMFLDRDKDDLDPDHYPIWFDFLVDVDGPLYSINEKNTLAWYVYMDNRQNTVSCVEREIRQQIGFGYVHKQNSFDIALNAYAGFYYIEIDDDTPVARDYTRQELDDGEASTAFEVEGHYYFNNTLDIYARVRNYFANTGFEELETNYEFQCSYHPKKSSFLRDDATLHVKIKYNQYNFDRFNVHTLDMLPWDNDMLIQAYVSIPYQF